jgi:CheY-like chemotaxis protein
VHVADSLRRYLTEWYGIQENNDTGTNEGFVIVDEEECSSWIGISRQRHKLIVVCDQSTRRRILQKYSKFSSSFEVLTTPFGPHKFFKVLIASFETSEENTRRTSPTSDSDESDRDHDRFSTLPIHEKQPTNHKIPISPVYKSPRLSENLMPGFRPSKQARVLCVDDNAINLRLLKTFMDKLGFQDVACAENGSIAFETVRLRPERFDLIFMDLSMPVCDGFESTSLIRSLEKLQSKIPTLEASGQKPALIVAVTGLANQRDHDAARAVGIDHFLSKPLKLSKLRELLGEWGILL